MIRNETKRNETKQHGYATMETFEEASKGIGKGETKVKSVPLKEATLATCPAPFPVTTITAPPVSVTLLVIYHSLLIYIISQ
jgi:hypothetical protein